MHQSVHDDVLHRHGSGFAVFGDLYAFLQKIGERLPDGLWLLGSSLRIGDLPRAKPSGEGRPAIADLIVATFSRMLGIMGVVGVAHFRPPEIEVGVISSQRDVQSGSLEASWF